MLLNFFHEALTFLTAPRKRYCLAVQAEQIVHNRQPPPLHLTMFNSQSNNTVQEPVAKEAATVIKDTGFPEPLSPDRNTTLPHPDADTSKNATIEAPDIALERTHSRRSFRHSRHHSSKSGKLTVEDTMRYDNIQYSDGTKEKSSPVAIAEMAEKSVDVVDAPAEDHELKEGESSTKEQGDEHGYKEGERKKGVLRKLHLHK